MATDLIRYDLLVQDALRSVVRRVLSEAARNGLPGEHHFNISFKTQAPGVALPAAIRQKYPDEMTIILQHEFWDLAVDADAFEVSLHFSRKAERLRIPFDAIIGFNDPSVPFGFKLEPRETATVAASSAPQAPPAAPTRKSQPAATPKPAPLAPPPPAKPVAAPEPAGAARGKSSEAAKPAETGEAAKVVSIDAFRKK
ncbi:MAG TPA: ClpXP protease specificity-enhancing factor SspB [Roseiarcus sp.]|nr:ClpXP protease specificity-enhancing factor SspB [Roseiarcus sp.]